MASTHRILELVLVVLAAVTVSSCGGVRLPRDMAQYTATCDRFEGDGSTSPTNSVFFMSSRQVDCRGEGLRFANFRATGLVYGEQEPDLASETPWLSSAIRSYSELIWLRRLQERIQRPENDGRLLIYVHGYRNTFESANERGWRLSRLYFADVPLLVVHWPSRYRYQSYSYDEESAEWAQEYLDLLLVKVAGQANKITIVGHSMGTRGVLRAVDHLDRTHPELSSNIRKVVLASPDVDRDTALRRDGIVRRLLQAQGRKMLIYASAKDRALLVSRRIHGYSRLGSSECRYDVDYRFRTGPASERCSFGPDLPGLAIVETGEVAARNLDRHGDYLESCFVQKDLAEFLQGDERGERNPPSFEWREPAGQGERTGYKISRKKAEELGICAAA
jgi:pimeloyl-ACP methyl ester carboxylesterase